MYVPRARAHYSRAAAAYTVCRERKREREEEAHWSITRLTSARGRPIARARRGDEDGVCVCEESFARGKERGIRTGSRVQSSRASYWFFLECVCVLVDM